MIKYYLKLFCISITLLSFSSNGYAQIDMSPGLNKEDGETLSLEALCQPDYLFGCSDADGFTDFALEQIQNLNNGCSDNTGFNGWSEYYTLGPASLIQGGTYNITLATGYQNQHVNIWIDFDDDLILDSDETILNDYIMLLPGILYSVPVFIPVDAPAGQHAMRAMSVFQFAFDDPCGSYLYGEAEDYYVQIEPGIYGSLEGYATELSGGAPIEGALISVSDVANATTGADGYYYIDQVLTGTWNVTCVKDGYNQASATITIVEGDTSSQDFQLTKPQLVVAPLSVSVTLETNTTSEETVNISNPGNGSLEWNTNIIITGDGGSDNLFGLQFDWPIGIGSNEAGIECDGNYIYTSKWNSAEFCKYELDGTFVGIFTCGNAGQVRDLAYDGTYFYGAAANTTVYQMDFVNGLLVSQFIAPTEVRAIAYNEDDNLFYANNWDSDITAFNLAGTNLGSFTVGPTGASYYGFAYDNYSAGAPFLWGYAQTGNSLNELVQIQLPTGVETGLSFDVGSVVSVGTGLAGGLAITSAIEPGFYTLLGRVLTTNVWGLELCESGSDWLTIDPNSGSLEGGQNQDLTLHFNSINLIPGFYNADVHFTADPNVGSPVIDVTLHVAGLIPAINLDLNYNCTDVILTWEMPEGGNADSWNVYKGGVLLGSATVMTFSDPMINPGVVYNYFVKAVYTGDESQPTPTENIIVPIPAALEPLNPEAFYQGINTVIISWEEPQGCLSPNEYNIYRAGILVGTSATLNFTDTGVPSGNNEYFVRAVYYFGESGNSEITYVVVGIDESSAVKFLFFPNPSSNRININSPFEITSIKIFSSSGKLIQANKPNGVHYSVDVSKLTKGIYYIKIETPEGEILKKIAVN